jgi:alpha-ketoglutarate-dependent taurine dioxygenase
VHHAIAAAPPRALPFIYARNPARPGGSGVDAFLDRWSDDADAIEAALHYCGAVLFRGFEIDHQDRFERVAGELKHDLVDYVDGNSPRTKVAAGVYTSTEYPPDYFISLHNELSYSARWPARLFFCCITAPDEGGETPLCDGRDLLAALPAGLVDRFRARGIQYIRNLHGGKGFGPSWQATFETIDRRVVEDHARATGMDLAWTSGGGVRLTIVRPATQRHPVTGEEVWFNQADQFHPSTHPRPVYESMLALYRGREDLLPQDARFGDGGAIPAEDLAVIRDVTRQQMARFPWQRGDLLMIDNMLVSHGRMPFRGPRKVLVAMTAR